MVQERKYMDNVIIRFSPRECLEIERIVMDRDEHEALAFVSYIRRRIRDTKTETMKDHIDGRKS
jgi:hypothetical protein